MASELLTTPARATDANGNIYGGATWYFYATGTTTPQAVYADAALDTSLGASVTSDSGGKFPAIYFDASKQYRGILKSADGSSTLHDIDPINQTLNAGTLTFTQSGSGAVPRMVQDRLRETVSVKDFGAVGDGATDDTAAINAALAYATAINSSLSYVDTNRLSVYFPAGSYWYDGGGLIGKGCVVHGAGRNASQIISRLASPTNGYLFRAEGYGSGIRSMRFVAGQTQTGGSYVWLSGIESFIEDFFMDGDFNGVLMTGNVSRIRHGRFQDGATGAIRIRAEGGDNSQIIDDVVMGAQTPQLSAAGIRVRNSSALMITNTSVVQQTIGLLIDPYSSVVGTPTTNTDSGSVFSLYANNCFFDGSGQNGIKIQPSGTGSVVRCRFSNCWASSSTNDGVAINNFGTGICTGLHFENLQAFLNGGSGMATGSGITDLVVRGGGFSQNAYGIYMNDAITGFTLTDAVIGTGFGLTGNTMAGLLIAAGSDQLTVIGNRFAGNGSAIADSSSGSASKNIVANIGYKTANQGQATIASSSTTVVVTHGLAEAPDLADIQLTRGAGNAGSVDLYVNNITATQFTINTSPAPTVDMPVVWHARIKGA